MAHKRHCSVCGLPGHTRRSHRVRRNVDFFTDRHGTRKVRHPIRGTTGYDPRKVGEKVKAKPTKTMQTKAPEGPTLKDLKIVRRYTLWTGGQFAEVRWGNRRVDVRLRANKSGGVNEWGSPYPFVETRASVIKQKALEKFRAMES